MGVIGSIEDLVCELRRRALTLRNKIVGIEMVKVQRKVDGVIESEEEFDFTTQIIENFEKKISEIYGVSYPKQSNFSDKTNDELGFGLEGKDYLDVKLNTLILYTLIILKSIFEKSPQGIVLNTLKSRKQNIEEILLLSFSEYPLLRTYTERIKNNLKVKYSEIINQDKSDIPHLLRKNNEVENEFKSKIIDIILYLKENGFKDLIIGFNFDDLYSINNIKILKNISVNKDLENILDKKFIEELLNLVVIGAYLIYILARLKDSNYERIVKDTELLEFNKGNIEEILNILTETDFIFIILYFTENLINKNSFLKSIPSTLDIEYKLFKNKYGIEITKEEYFKLKEVDIENKVGNIEENRKKVLIKLICGSVNYYVSKKEELEKLVELIRSFDENYIKEIECFLNNKNLSNLKIGEKIKIIENKLINFILNFSKESISYVVKLVNKGINIEDLKRLNEEEILFAKEKSGDSIDTFRIVFNIIINNRENYKGAYSKYLIEKNNGAKIVETTIEETRTTITGISLNIDLIEIFGEENANIINERSFPDELLKQIKKIGEIISEDDKEYFVIWLSEISSGNFNDLKKIFKIISAIEIIIIFRENNYIDFSFIIENIETKIDTKYLREFITSKKGNSNIYELIQSIKKYLISGELK